MKTLLLFFAFLCPVLLHAEDIRFVPGVTVTAAVTLVTDANGVLQIDRSQPILINTISISPETPTNPEEPEEPTNPLSQKVSELLKSAPNQTEDKKSRETISELLNMTGNLPLSDPQQILQATTVLFDALPLSDKWKTWKTTLDEYAGSLDGDDVKTVWSLLSKGLK